MSRSDAAIGIFDSGFGGLTVARTLRDLLPHEKLIYLGDSARAPYGDKDIDAVRRYTLQGLDWLVSQGVKMLVIACNSGSAAALESARERYDVPVVEVVVPAATKAARVTRNNHVGLICTEMTKASGTYQQALAGTEVTLHTSACPRFVPLVEAGITTGPHVLAVAREYLDPLKAADVDTLILGCTHYPLLTGPISFIMGPGVTLVSSAEQAAREVFAVLTRTDTLADGTGSISFYTTGDPHTFRVRGSQLLGGFVTDVGSVTFA